MRQSESDVASNDLGYGSPEGGNAGRTEFVNVGAKVAESNLSVEVTIGLFITYLTAGFFGYGNDSDSYLLLMSGQNLWLNGFYEYSRPPSYLIPEIILGASSLVGGHVLANAVSAFMAASTLYFFWRLLAGTFSRLTILLMVLTVGLNPIYFIAASSSMDYVYGLFFGMAGVWAYKSGWLVAGAALFALAGASRLSNCLVIGLLFLYFLVCAFRSGDRAHAIGLVYSGLLAFCLVLLLYLPAYFAADRSLRFLTYAIGEWNFFGYASRFIYKNLYLFGLLPLVTLSVLVLLAVIGRRTVQGVTREMWFGIAVVLVQEMVFAKAPLEIAYLLPLLFVILPLLCSVFALQSWQLALLLAATVSYGFTLNIDLLERRYNENRTEAVAATAGIYIRQGVVIADIQRRGESQAYYFNVYDIPDKSGSVTTE